jgi:two-component system sensor histidine kinase VicK
VANRRPFPGGLFLYNLKEGRFEYVNPAFEEVWEREEADLNDRLPWLLETVYPEGLPLLQNCYAQLQTNAFREFRIQTGKCEKWIYLTAYALRHDGQRWAIAGFAEDITHHKENETRLNAFSAHKNGMLEMLAHDLNGPLGVVRQLAGHLEKKAGERGQPDIQEDAALIRRTVRHSVQMIHDLLEKESLESSRTALKIQRVELIEQINAMLQGFERMSQDHHKHFMVESSGSRVFAEIDQVKFMHALQNLVSNATKFTRKNGHIRISVQEEPGSLLIAVRDDCIGIPKALQGELFERFTKALRPGLAGEVTTGLGLSIVKRIVELHRGQVWVESEENQGAAFLIRIPRQG